ncbi:hypothetical protein ACI3EY_07845 [Ornithinimicrobium sp. LYQ92]|uniref:hypothetical protein n=1 Tax=Serinicoccus sp. LYQ92 TaxID=3378798 RepID=UPI0038543ED3
MSTTPSTSTITAIPRGTLRGGSAIPRKTFNLTRPPEEFGPGRSRLWAVCAASARHGLNREAPVAVVHTASIEAVSA